LFWYQSNIPSPSETVMNNNSKTTDLTDEGHADLFFHVTDMFYYK